MMFSQGEGSAVIHRKKNYLIYSDATHLCRSLWQCEITCSCKELGGKRAQDPPRSLHTIVSPVDWTSSGGGVRGDSPWEQWPGL